MYPLWLHSWPCCHAFSSSSSSPSVNSFSDINGKYLSPNWSGQDPHVCRLTAIKPNQDVILKFFLQIPFVGPQIQLFWVSEDISSGFWRQSCTALFALGGGIFRRFTSGVTPANLLVASMAPKSISSAYLRAGIGRTWNWDLPYRRQTLHQPSYAVRLIKTSFKHHLRTTNQPSLHPFDTQIITCRCFHNRWSGVFVCLQPVPPCGLIRVLTGVSTCKVLQRSTFCQWRHVCVDRVFIPLCAPPGSTHLSIRSTPGGKLTQK